MVFGGYQMGATGFILWKIFQLDMSRGESCGEAWLCLAFVMYQKPFPVAWARGHHGSISSHRNSYHNISWVGCGKMMTNMILVMSTEVKVSVHHKHVNSRSVIMRCSLFTLLPVWSKKAVKVIKLQSNFLRFLQHCGICLSFRNGKRHQKIGWHRVTWP